MMHLTSLDRPLTEQARATEADPAPFPLFIVGCPRSGTKLLRELLNNHPDISLGHEGHYIPLLIAHLGLNADLTKRETWGHIFTVFAQSAFYQYKKPEENLSREAFLGSYDALVASGVTPTWSHALKLLLRAYSPRSEAKVWGDKSQGYLFHVPLLRNLFSDVRFLYLVRDPRDQALSAQRAWGKHPLRSAQRWLEAAREAERVNLTTSADALVLRYEDLTGAPAETLERACTFLGVPYTEQLNTLARPTENLGDTRGRAEVVAQRRKYREALSPDLVRRISEITLPYLAHYGYPTEGARGHHALPPVRRRQLRYLDGFASLRFHMREKGLLEGARYYWLRRQ